MSKFVPSKYQQALFTWIKEGQGSAIVEAVAGSGKTTSVLQSLNMIDSKKSILFLAFNKSIATELQERAPKYVNCMTMNSLGHKAVMKRFGYLQLETTKTKMIIERMIDASLMSVNEGYSLGFVVTKLVAMAKAVGISPKISGKISLLEDNYTTWENLMDHYDVEVGSSDTPIDQVKAMTLRAIDLARTALDLSIKETKIIDFNDQLYLPVVYGLPFPQYDWVFVDEAQDISAIQRVMLTKALKKDGRLVAVGDPRQAIYGFRGADSDSLVNIAKTFNCISLPLSISYRCPQAVVREAQSVVSHIEASETAPEGRVAHLGLLKPDMFKVNDMVVCRNSAPLIQLAYLLIGNKIPAKVMGRDIGEGLITLIKKLKARNIPQLGEKLEVWKDREIAKLVAKDPEANISKVEDRYECLKCFMEFSGAQDIDNLIRAIQSMFGEGSVGVVQLSTIHKAKGLEAKRVFILDAWRMPSKYAKKAHQLEQEYNLLYVAITRAQEELLYVELPVKKKGAA